MKLLQRIKRGAYLIICGTLAVIRLNLGPGDLSRFVDHVNGRMRDAVVLRALVSWIAQSVFVNNPMFRIREDRKFDVAFAVCRDLFRKLLAHIGRIDADRVELYILVLLQQRA